MRLIPRKALQQRFRELVHRAQKVDTAVAWAKPCDAVDALVEAAEAGKRILVAVGLSFNGTDPTTLQKLQGSVKQRIVSPPRGIFHPKYFCFRNRNRTTYWVGSTNLSAGGFGGNVELVSEFEDDTKEGQRWFELSGRNWPPTPNQPSRNTNRITTEHPLNRKVSSDHNTEATHQSSRRSSLKRHGTTSLKDSTLVTATVTILWTGITSGTKNGMCWTNDAAISTRFSLGEKSCGSRKIVGKF